MIILISLLPLCTSINDINITKQHKYDDGKGRQKEIGRISMLKRGRNDKNET